jgi:nucleoside-diphosphate-sugar epimerase
MSLFITGSEAFIGGNLIRVCQTKGMAVTGVDAIAPTRPGFKQADICDPAVADLIPEGATVVHLAAISRDPDCRADPIRAFKVNVEGTLNLAAAARKRGAKQFIFASSEWVYGDVRNDETQVESQPIDLTGMKSEYAISKLTAEQLLKLGMTEAMPITVLRFGIVYGPRDNNWSAVESLVNNVYRGNEIKVGSAKTARRFIHVDDIVSGILAAQDQKGFTIYNLSGDTLVSLGDVVNTAANVSGKAANFQETNPANVSIRNPDNAKIKAALPWKQTIHIEDGVKTLIAHFSGKK